MFSGGLIGAKGQRRVVELMDREGMAPDWLKEIDWEGVDALGATQEAMEPITEAFGEFFKTKTKAWLLKQAVAGGIMLAPVNTIKDVTEDPQLKARDCWIDVAHPEMGTTITYPGAPCKLTETPWQIKGRAPVIGEHNSDIYERELGLSKEEMAALKEAGAI